MPLLLGGIVMWAGSINEIPEGWALCNGQNGTIDLRNRFVVGAGSLYSVGATGGSADAVLVSHNHSLTINAGGGHAHTVFAGNTFNSNSTGLAGSFVRANNIQYNYESGQSTAEGSHNHSVTINSTGSSETNANLPPYYALAFIQQIQ